MEDNRKLNWIQYFFNLVEMVKMKSKDPSTKVGCVIIGPDNEIRSTGYNGFPRMVIDDIDERYERPIKYKYTEHAERNAIYAAARVGTPLKGCNIFISIFPCTDCARAIIQSGIDRVYVSKASREDEKFATWKEDWIISEQMLHEAAVDIAYIEDLI